MGLEFVASGFVGLGCLVFVNCALSLLRIRGFEVYTLGFCWLGI